MSIDIEDLNKSQIILLTMLVSFVTSIATGIVTVSLMEKAPKDVVRVVQRVVERTVERVEKAAPDTPQKKVIVEEKTIIVKEGDLIAQAIAQNRGRTLAIYEKESEKFVALAVPVSPSTLITDAGVVNPEKAYFVNLPDDKTLDISFVKGGGARALAMFKISETDSDAKFKKMTFGKNDPQLGQSVFLFTDPALNSVAQGIVSSSQASYLDIDIDPRKILPGSPIFNSSGDFVGISTAASRENAPNSFIKYTAVSAFKEAPENDKQNQSSNSATSSKSASENALRQEASASGAFDSAQSGAEDSAQ